MSFFQTLTISKNSDQDKKQALWKYEISDEDLDRLISTLKYGQIYNIDPKDVCLYYAVWWKRKYNGGIPSKQEIFESIGGNLKYNLTKEEFFKLAKIGAQQLGVKWIKKQNTLYFKTLLLQGGLPLKHIAENKGVYKVFLEAVLEEQPESIEDFIFKNHIIGLLPKSSQNDTIYENCFEIVRSILNDDGAYDSLFESEESLKEISTALKIKRNSLVKKKRQSKPKNYWLLNFKNDIPKITLRLGFANTYTKEALSNILTFEPIESNYQFFMDDNLVCVFRKMANGRYRTDWYGSQNEERDILEGIPHTYVVGDDLKTELPEFIQTIPNLDEPSLWSRFNDNEWRLVKGYTVSNNDAALLYPNNWQCFLPATNISIYDKTLSWVSFEGEIEIQSENEQKTYISGVDSFDWIIESKRPSWMLKSNLAVTQGVPKILLYDDSGYDINNSRFTTFIKRHNSKEQWESLSRIKNISKGCYDLKIEKDGVIAHDTFFNIGNLKARFLEQTIDSAVVDFSNNDFYELKLTETDLVQIEQTENRYSLKVNKEKLKIPSIIKGSFGLSNKKKLFFDMRSPFQGMAITDSEGGIIEENQPLSLANLYGLRILSTPKRETLLKLKNSLKPDVKITKEIKESTQPLIAYKDEIVRLLYLADVMNHENTVTLELSEGSYRRTYRISGFSHTLDVSNQLEYLVDVFNSSDKLELYAVALNCNSEKLAPISLTKIESGYEIPTSIESNELIVFSSKIDGKQLMPRFVRTTELYSGIDKAERIEKYHTNLSSAGFSDEIWKQVLSYFKICIDFDIPFSTFDQLRAISRSSNVASRTFLYLGINHHDPNEYIQNVIPEMEKDLGFCFHWISKIDWGNAIEEVNELTGNNYYNHILELLSSYLSLNGQSKLFKFISGAKIETNSITQRDILDLRQQLGERVLKELPYHSPKINSTYSIQIEQHKAVKVLLRSPIAVAESINNIENENPIWGGDDFRDVIRRNIQYSQYLKPDFYNSIILHVLNRN